jgi:hypothetical protein
MRKRPRSIIRCLDNGLTREEHMTFGKALGNIESQLQTMMDKITTTYGVSSRQALTLGNLCRLSRLSEVLTALDDAWVAEGHELPSPYFRRYELGT